MNKIYLSFLLILLIILPGCSMNEIEEYSIVAGIAIDYKDEQYEVTYEIYKENNGETTSLTSLITSSKGKTISEAMNNIANSMYQVPYLNHCLLLIFNEDLLKNSFDEALNYFIHDVRIRSSCYVAVSKTTAKEILETSQDIKQVVSYNLYKKFDQLPKQVNIWSNSTFNNIMNETIFENGVNILPIVEYNKNFNIDNVFIIRKDNIIFKAKPEEVFIFQLFSDTVDEGIINIKDYCVYLKKLDSKLKYNNNELLLELNMQLLSYDDAKIDIQNPEKKEEIIKELSEELEMNIKNIFKKYQEKKVDPFYIYRLLEKKDNKLYQKIKYQYYNFFSEVNLNLNINIDILTSGLSEERLE